MKNLISAKDTPPASAGRQEEILKAAAKIFRRKGYHASTIRDIAEEVGMLKGSLYHHIDGKEQLLMDLIMAAVDALQAGIEDVVVRDISPSKKLRQLIISHMRSYETHDDEVSVFFNEVSNLPPHLKEKLLNSISTYEGRWLDVIRDAMKCGDFRENVDPRLTLYAIFGMCNWTHKWYRRQDRLRLDEIAEIYADIVLSGIERSNDVKPLVRTHGES